MLFLNRGRLTLLKSLPLLSKFCTTSYFSSQTNWIHHNQLFQRHPRLQLLQEKCKTFYHLQQILSYILVSGLHRNPFVMSRLLYFSLFDLELRNGKEKSEIGLQIFSQIKEPNIFCWNTMIRFFAAFEPVAALDYYMMMLTKGIFPDKYTFPHLLQACGANFDLGSVKQVHCHALKLVFNHDLFVENSLLNAYMICGSTANAWLVFDEMPEKDVVSWTSLITGLISQSNYCDAIFVFRKLMADDCYSQPNVITIMSIVSASGSLGSIELTQCLHAFVEKAGWLALDVSVVNSLIDSYAKCGNLCYARTVFDGVQNIEKDLYSWTSIISGYAMHGRGRDALNLFSRMEQGYALVLDAVTFIPVLSACAHSGLVEEGLCIFESMTAKYRINPDIRHYGCIIDLLGRAGMVERAYSIVKNMPMEPNLAVLGSLLSSCRLHNNLEIGEAVLRKIEFLNERGGASVLLSNMYANQNQWSKVICIRKEMRGRIQGKPPGRSWIQVKDAVHEFMARSETDAQAMELHFVLEGLEKVSRFS